MSEIQWIVVLGVGIMGYGIVQVCVMVGYDTYLMDVSLEVVVCGAEWICKNLDKGIVRGKVTEVERDVVLVCFRSLGDVCVVVVDVDLIIEVVLENMEFKKWIVREVAGAVFEYCIVGTNILLLSVIEIVVVVLYSEAVVGLYFFNFVYIMKLFEVVRVEQIFFEMLVMVKVVGARLGKELIVVFDFVGFVISRLGLILGLEAMWMLEVGVVSAVEIDKVMEFGYWYLMGLLKLIDLVGLDVWFVIVDYFFWEVGF